MTTISNPKYCSLFKSDWEQVSNIYNVGIDTGNATFESEVPTMYRNNSRDISKFKGCSLLQLSCNLTGKYHAVGYYSYTKR